MQNASFAAGINVRTSNVCKSDIAYLNKTMPEGYKIRNQSAIHFITFATVEWIDVFTSHISADIVVDSLKYCQKEKGLIIYAWCIMSNHVHLIVRTEGNKLSDVLRDFKKHTSKQILAEIESNPSESRKEWMLESFNKAGKERSNIKHNQFWRQNNKPIELFSNAVIEQKALSSLVSAPLKLRRVRFAPTLCRAQRKLRRLKFSEIISVRYIIKFRTLQYDFKFILVL